MSNQILEKPNMLGPVIEDFEAIKLKAGEIELVVDEIERCLASLNEKLAETRYTIIATEETIAYKTFKHLVRERKKDQKKIQDLQRQVDDLLGILPVTP